MSENKGLAASVADRMNVTAAASYVGLSASTLNMMRCQGKGPRYLKLSSRVYYRKSDLDAYIAAGTVETEDSRRSASA